MTRKEELIKHFDELPVEDLAHLLAGNCRICPKFIKNACQHETLFMSCEDLIEYVLLNEGRF